MLIYNKLLLVFSEKPETLVLFSDPHGFCWSMPTVSAYNSFTTSKIPLIPLWSGEIPLISFCSSEIPLISFCSSACETVRIEYKVCASVLIKLRNIRFKISSRIGYKRRVQSILNSTIKSKNEIIACKLMEYSNYTTPQ